MKRKARHIRNLGEEIKAKRRGDPIFYIPSKVDSSQVGMTIHAAHVGTRTSLVGGLLCPPPCTVGSLLALAGKSIGLLF